MQTIRRALLLLLGLFAPVFLPLAHAVKVHTVALGAAKRVPYTPPEATPDTKGEDSTSLKVRPLIVDGKVREWTVGDMHEITDRTFVIRRVLHVNDALPGEAPRWVWQPGPWLSVDRVSARVSALHLPDFDPQVSEIIWYRDFAAYCGLHLTAKSSTLQAVVIELGSRRPAVSQKLSFWPPEPIPHPACAATTWQRLPMRATFHPTGLKDVTISISGLTALIEDNDNSDE
ncbi:hypothetical protein ACFQBQ_08590 [Granulicella cerasi]|uniref:DUF3108 domain-containing protein n=1 Tax=Granulicella cerasi TaxID=741063 RepID=A0ABW1ZAR8_9BACT|nr:hypothetical protein [Granulicella cerasi]